MPVKTNYEIKTLSDKYAEQAVKLWELCFGPPYNIHDAYSYIKEQLSYSVGAFSEDKLVATLAIIDFDIRLSNVWLPCGGVAGIATLPEHRRQNIVWQLVEDGLNHLNQKGIPITTLWPFSYSFYEKMGWSVTNWQYQIKIDLPNLHKLGKSNNYQSIPLTEYPKLQNIHDHWCEQWNFSLRRNDRRWRRLLKRQDFVGQLFIHQDGYMLWDMANSKDGILNVKEWVYASHQAFVDGLALIGQMDSQYKRASWLSGEVDSLTNLSLLDKVEVQMKPGMMSRMLNTKSFHQAFSSTKSLTIKDPMGISGDKNKGDIGPGELMQAISGFSPQIRQKFPDIEPILAPRQAFVIEKY